MEHKKIYTVNTDGDAKLVADIDAPVNTTERHHRRRESAERGGYLNSGRERDRGRRDYYPSGRSRARDASIEDKDAYSYTDPAAMYATTEPRWREGVPRPRRGSMDRGSSRDRPASLLVEPSYGDPRSSTKELGPPPSMRGWESVNKIGRSQTLRDSDRPRVAQSPIRGRFPDAGGYGEQRDPYYVPPRASSKDGRSQAVHHDRPVERGFDYDRERETRRERRNSVTRRGDGSVTRRGFGIRSDSQDRYGRDGRGSDENIKERERQAYRDSGYAEPHRRDTMPEIPYHEERRLEQEKKDREFARQQADTRERQYEREQRREEDRAHDHGFDRERKDRDREYDRVETERERERQRMMEREPERERDRERHHHRRDTDRDRDYRKENGDGSTTAGLSQAATGGLAGAAAAFGLNKMLNRDKNDDRKDDRERDRDYKRDDKRDRDSDREREREREREKDRDSDRKRHEEPPRRDDRERRHRDNASHSEDSAPFDRGHRDPGHKDADRGLGFAFERPQEPPRASAPTSVPASDWQREPEREQQRAFERVQERDFERDHDDGGSADNSKPAIDPEEDYRRRLEQVQRELGRAPPADERNSSDSDPDRERRRREREQRQREKEERELHEPKLEAGVGITGLSEQQQHPPPPLRKSFDDTISESNASSAQQGLRRKPSILNEPMQAGDAQIIDNSMSDKRENRVRIVDPPTEDEEKKPKGILKQPTQKFPEYPQEAREGALPITKDVSCGDIEATEDHADVQSQATAKGIPPGARWTKIDRRLVNPEALEEAKERFEERLDCVIVLRVLTKEDIQKLADRTREIRGKRHPFITLDDNDELGLATPAEGLGAARSSNASASAAE
jgi:zinc finger CCCH domain-containing protein 13